MSKSIVSTIWSHPSDMDKERMRQVQQQWAENPNLTNIYWFEINNTTHGSVSIFNSKLAFEKNLSLQEEHRKNSTTEHKIKMTHEVKGECFAILYE